MNRPFTKFRKGDIVRIRNCNITYTWYKTDLFIIVSHTFQYNIGDNFQASNLKEIHESKINSLSDNVYFSNVLVNVCSLKTNKYDTYGEINMEIDIR